MKLQGKRLVWANELDEGKKLSTAMVKWLVGGDSITARPLYGVETTFRPTHTIFLLTNHKPVVDAEDYALWQRLHLIPFKLSFVDNPTKPNERKRDMDLVRRFTHIEDQGILTWAVKGCLDWQGRGLLPPKVVTTAVREYAEEEDYLKMFLEEETVVGVEGWTRSLDTYTRYREWAGARGMVVCSLTKFGRDISGKVEKRKRNTANEYNLWLKVRR
jgi:putative DNA primase/helicase